ncbi:MAG: hypothetical protein ACLSB9_26545 [Hydrogeniiclostridium mannosilyticum]
MEKFDRPYFLAGGLGPDNAADAVERLHPYAVDVSSGIETAGKKDPQKWRHLWPLYAKMTHQERNERP